MFVIDSFELARKCEVIEGELSMKDMPELQGVISSIKGDAIRFTAEGLGAVRGLPAARLTIEGTVMVPCGVCLKDEEYPISQTCVYRFVKSEQEANEIPVGEDEEEEEVIIGSRSFSIAQWVQEELLLLIPYAFTHDECVVQADEPLLADEEPEQDSETQRPFANLKSMLKH